MAAENNRGDRLGVNRASAKVTKKPTAVARPAPKVYNIHPSFFRDLVQELTGKSFEPETSLQQTPKLQTPTNPPPPPAVAQPSVNFNGRLQKFAPPPLDSGAGSGSLCESPIKFDFFNLSPIPIVSPGLFSPVTGSVPMEWKWPDDMASASPTSLEYWRLVQSLSERPAKEDDNEPALALSPSAFRMSPARDSNARSPVPSNGLGSPAPSLLFSPRCGNLSPTFPLPSPRSFAGFDLGTM